MFRIYSEVEKGKLLCSFSKGLELSSYRSELSPDEEYLQVSGRKIEAGTHVKAHKHLPLERKTEATQEAWVIVEGSVEAIIYDLDDTILRKILLGRGDCLVLFRGGHALDVVDEDTIMYEFKTGPYYGMQKDKVAINET